MDDAKIRKMDEAGIQKMEDTKIRKMDDAKIRKIDDAKIRKMDDAKIRQMDDAKIGKMDDAKIPKMDDDKIRNIDDGKKELWLHVCNQGNLQVDLWMEKDALWLEKGSISFYVEYSQMLFMAEWNMIMFLGTPVMPDLDSMINTGLYINDLSMHDFSRDLMLAGTQQSVELKLALDQEQQKSKKLEISMQKLDEEMKRTDELLYQMIPKTVADRLRKGENPVSTCQMLFMAEWNMIMFLGTPVMPDLDSMINTGLYINDLSMHDFSRDLMLAGTQQSVELKLALDQEQQKSKKLEISMQKLDEEMKRTDELLYQMIPKTVADRLRKGENPVSTCQQPFLVLAISFQVFDSVTILFSDVVSFTSICSRITPLEVVSMLNSMYSLFDKLTERNKVYKASEKSNKFQAVDFAL
ncbi:unnamed protein product [Cyprideis torosa]|uniref:guanylate cyclase n=1 Tax=Cyprideis torosa TaxID=163714 RepID=A0A7R8W0N8_9CRUS|nr:unnamed protein product [Cyprideis torosa]CAG0878897.1 unnamed protein product [Cyprideis torosa]